MIEFFKYKREFASCFIQKIPKGNEKSTIAGISDIKIKCGLLCLKVLNCFMLFYSNTNGQLSLSIWATTGKYFYIQSYHIL